MKVFICYLFLGLKLWFMICFFFKWVFGICDLNSWICLGFVDMKLILGLIEVKI